MVGHSTESPVPRRTAVTATVTAAVVNLALLAAGTAAGASFIAPQRGQDGGALEIGPGAVLVSTLLPLVAGLAVTVLAVRRWPSASRVLQALAVLVTIGSLGMPLTTDTDTGTRVLLAAMHLVVGGAYLWATRAQRRHSDTRQPAAPTATERAR